VGRWREGGRDGIRSVVRGDAESWTDHWNPCALCGVAKAIANATAAAAAGRLLVVIVLVPALLIDTTTVVSTTGIGLPHAHCLRACGQRLHAAPLRGRKKKKNEAAS
jgi:hypothetical protein